MNNKKLLIPNLEYMRTSKCVCFPLDHHQFRSQTFSAVLHMTFQYFTILTSSDKCTQTGKITTLIQPIKRHDKNQKIDLNNFIDSKITIN